MSRFQLLPFVSLLPIVFAAAAQARSVEQLHAPGDAKLPSRAYSVEPEPPASSEPRSEREAGRELAAPPGALSAPRDRVHFDVEEDGTAWARGRTWKACFAPDAATYVPFFGSRAPQNHPLSLRVESVTIGGKPLEFERDAPAELQEGSVVYERGAFRERYLLLPDSVEQTFEFDLLSRRGEIVVTLAVETDLAPGSDGEGFRFSNELGHVRYGRAFAFDEHGAATPIASRLCPRTIELVAPAELVEAAVGRFVIDPVMSTSALEDSAIDAFAADTSYDVTNSTWLTVYEEVFSASDHDVHALRHDMLGTITSDQYVDTSSEDWRAPAVANNKVDDQFLVVATRGATGSRQIFGRTVEATISLNLSPKFAISQPDEGFDVYSPDVGGDPKSYGTTAYLVVWERPFVPGTFHDIHGRMVRTNATLYGSTLGINNSLAYHRNPSVSNMNGVAPDAEREWTVVWENEVSPTNHDILGARISAVGVIVDPTFPVASSLLDERNPSSTSEGLAAFEGAVRPWMVAYQVQGGASGWDVRCRTLDGTSVLSTFDLSDEFPTANLDQVNPSCDTSGGQFVVAYDEHPAGGFGSSDVKVSSLFSISGALGVNEGDVSASPGLHLDARPRVVGRGTWSASLSHTLVVFDRDDGGPNDVYATGYAIPFGGPVASFCSGDGSGTACPCSNEGASGHGCANSVDGAGALLVSFGAAKLSYDVMQMTVSGVPATAPVLLFQGTSETNGGAGFALGDGLRCAGGSLIRLGVRTASGGSASFPSSGNPSISEQGLVPPAGALRTYQAWYRDPTSFCTGATYNLTNGLSVQWIP